MDDSGKKARRIYLDYAATTPMHPDVVDAMIPYMSGVFGNPSSGHSYGQEARAAVDDARAKVASLIGAAIDEIVFTSGGTESDNLALKGVAYANRDRGNHIITTSVEHLAVIEPCRFLRDQGFDVTYLPVDEYGLVDPGDVARAITERTILISVMYANNEVGAIEPIIEIGKITKSRGVYFHTDAVQAAGRLPVNVDELGVDLMSISAHKLYGPKGVGALYVREGVEMVSFLHGGEQEHMRRASTENVMGVVGFGAAMEIAAGEVATEPDRMAALRDRLASGIFERIDGVRLNGHPERRLPNNVNVTFDFVDGQALARQLDMADVAVSTASACQSGRKDPSHVLMAMGYSSDEARNSIRFSLGRETTAEEIDYVLDVLPAIIEGLRKQSPQSEE
ncbi:MAG: cysteine desulfurase NifS [Chloroflexota bacterium]|nr:cysteine desulfurase NifS [Chloroflexota bacterium]